MRQTEYPHNSPEQVREYLEAALRLVAELNPPDDLRPFVFTKAVDLTANKQIVLEQAQLSPFAGVAPGR